MAFRLDPSAPLPAEFRRSGLSQFDQTLGWLEKAHHDHAKGLHETRKSIKKLRALLRLLRGSERDFARRENARLRDAARLISGPRDATAMVETLDRMIAAHPDKVASASLDLVRKRLAARRDRIGADLAVLEPAVTNATREVMTSRAAFSLAAFATLTPAMLASSVRHAVRAWKKAMRRAARRGRDDDFHDMRKAVKAHAAQLSLLETYWGGPRKRYSDRVDRLGELLGNFNDLTVLRDAIRAGDIDLGTDIDIAPLFALIAKDTAALRRKSLRLARNLYPKRPKRPTRRFAKAVQA